MKKKNDLVTVLLFCGFLLTMAVLYLLLPTRDYSVEEKRYLAEAPVFSRETVLSGQWGENAETYLADHIPGRKFFVGLNAYFDLLTGRQASKDIRVIGDRLVEAPAAGDRGEANVASVNDFAEAIQRNVDLMLIPSAGWAAGLEGYRDDTILRALFDRSGELVTPVEVTSIYDGRPELYYRTDHHWTSQGAYLGYQAYVFARGRDCRSEEMFRKETVEGFQGSTYSRSALWLTPGENLELWHGSEDFTVVNGETEEPHRGIFYRERLAEADKYTVFLDGNHSIVRITNPEKTGKLLVIRDSFSNCLGGFLAESYGEVVLVDLRYYRQPVSRLVSEEAFDDILVCYSIGNFLSDTNLPLLR